MDLEDDLAAPDSLPASDGLDHVVGQGVRLGPGSPAGIGPIEKGGLVGDIGQGALDLAVGLAGELELGLGGSDDLEAGNIEVKFQDLLCFPGESAQGDRDGPGRGVADVDLGGLEGQGQGQRGGGGGGEESEHVGEAEG